MPEDIESRLSFAESNPDLPKLRGVADALHPVASQMTPEQSERFRVIEDSLRQKLSSYAEFGR